MRGVKCMICNGMSICHANATFIPSALIYLGHGRGAVLRRRVGEICLEPRTVVATPSFSHHLEGLKLLYEVCTVLDRYVLGTHSHMWRIRSSPFSSLGPVWCLSCFQAQCRRTKDPSVWGNTPTRRFGARRGWRRCSILKNADRSLGHSSI